jgi:DNA-binding NarL/FixJ family response regulator
VWNGTSWTSPADIPGAAVGDIKSVQAVGLTDGRVVVVWSEAMDDGFALRSAVRGAGGAWSAVETVAEHKPFFTGMVSEALLQSFLTKGNDSPLTARERSVVQLIAEGHSNKKIASILNLSVKTVETHRAAAHRKLNLRSTADLVRYAIRNKIIEA